MFVVYVLCNYVLSFASIVPVWAPSMAFPTSGGIHTELQSPP